MGTLGLREEQCRQGVRGSVRRCLWLLHRVNGYSCWENTATYLLRSITKSTARAKASMEMGQKNILLL